MGGYPLLCRGRRRRHGGGSMLLSFSCPAIISLHGLFTVWVVSVKQSLMNGIAAQCTAYHVWLPSLDMAEEVRPDSCRDMCSRCCNTSANPIWLANLTLTAA